MPPRPVKLFIRGYKGSAGVPTEGIGNESESWDVAGRCTSGAMKGWTPEPVESVVYKWFAWLAEHPETEVFKPSVR